MGSKKNSHWFIETMKYNVCTCYQAPPTLVVPTENGSLYYYSPMLSIPPTIFLSLPSKIAPLKKNCGFGGFFKMLLIQRKMGVQKKVSISFNLRLFNSLKTILCLLCITLHSIRQNPCPQFFLI